MNTRMYFEKLNIKQQLQLIRLCEEFQPYMPFNEVVFLELVSATRVYCDRSVYPFQDDKEKRFRNILMNDLIAKVKGKYYFNGIKPNGKLLENVRYRTIHSYVPRVKTASLGINDVRTYRPIEKVLFVKLVRACRDFLRAMMSKEAEQEFFERLNVVYDAMA
ncbi:hypothetical protein [Bacteroides uniformis]|uniref:hypothetical protein n=1 Tax=Bacteroides uniformis TaxID=820 RepID=UPI001C0155F4|nr:hypothetical protein [Bacteroides uniformis]MBT9923588.1 hypothetical protein [Bacteroides uniformis]